MSEKLSIDDQLREAKSGREYWFGRCEKLEDQLKDSHRSALELARKVDAANAIIESLATTIEDRCNDIDELKAEIAALRERVKVSENRSDLSRPFNVLNTPPEDSTARPAPSPYSIESTDTPPEDA